MNDARDPGTRMRQALTEALAAVEDAELRLDRAAAALRRELAEAVPAAPPDPDTPCPTESPAPPAAPPSGGTVTPGAAAGPSLPSPAAAPPPGAPDQGRPPAQGGVLPRPPAPAAPWWTDESRVVRVVSVGGGVITVLGVILLVTLAVQAGLLGPLGRVVLAYSFAAATATGAWATARRGMRPIVPATLATVSAYAMMLTSSSLSFLLGWIPAAAAVILVGTAAVAAAAGLRPLRGSAGVTAVIVAAAMIMPLTATGTVVRDDAGAPLAGSLTFAAIAGCALTWWGSSRARSMPSIAVIALAVVGWAVVPLATIGDIDSEVSAAMAMCVLGISLAAVLAMASRRPVWRRAHVTHLLAGLAMAVMPTAAAAPVIANEILDAPLGDRPVLAPAVAVALAAAGLVIARLLPPSRVEAVENPDAPEGSRAPVAPLPPKTTMHAMAVVAFLPIIWLATMLDSGLWDALLLVGVPLAVVVWRRCSATVLLEVAMWTWLVVMVCWGHRTVIDPVFVARRDVSAGDLASAILQIGVAAALVAVCVDVLAVLRSAARDRADAPATEDVPARGAGNARGDRAGGRIRPLLIAFAALLCTAAPILLLIQAAGGGFPLAHMVVSVLWMGAAAFLLLSPPRLTGDAPASAGLLLAAAATAKLVLFDMSAMNGWARAFAFLICGVILLIMAIGRSRRSGGDDDRRRARHEAEAPSRGQL